MGYIENEIIKLAQSQVGYVENPLGSNHQKYSQFFDTPISKNGPYPWFNGKKQNVPYCAIGICWLLCMVLKPLLGSYDKVRQWLKFPKPADNCAAGCPYLWQYLKARFKAVDKKSGGYCDVIFFNAKCTHVGIIESVSGGRYHTIEFNCDNGVRRRSYDMGSSKIYGIIHMDFSDIQPKEEEPTPDPVAKPEPEKPVVPVYPKYKVKTVTGEWLALRVASNTKSVLIARMPQGSELELMKTVKGEKKYGSDEWAYVKYLKTNQCGYCLKSRIKAV